MKLYFETTEIMRDLCGLYCDAKPFWWRLFFGWRKTTARGAYFKMSERLTERLKNSLTSGMNTKFCKISRWGEIPTSFYFVIFGKCRNTPQFNYEQTMNKF